MVEHHYTNSVEKHYEMWKCELFAVFWGLTHGDPGLLWVIG